MKMDTNVIESHQSGGGDKIAYKVAQTAKLMNMLSNLLYKDKITAVIRELSTNAWDAHIMSGNTPDLKPGATTYWESTGNVPSVPTITLPTRLSLNYSIRDYGLGLSVEKLEKMYTTYGESDKTDSNDTNGCMGVGSKSPFAYTNSFTTTSYYNGMKYVYINSKDASGMPNLRKFHEEETTEPNGLEISFSVAPNDVSDFSSKASKVLSFFPHPFNIENDGYFNAIDRVQDGSDSIFDGDTWTFLRNSYSNSASYIVMGNVPYPIDMAHFDTKASHIHGGAGQAPAGVDNDWYQHYGKIESTVNINPHDVLKCGLEIRCDIGDVEMDASREGLQYTEKTIKYIYEFIHKNIIGTFKQHLDDEFDTCETLWEARKLVHKLRNSYDSNLNSIIRNLLRSYQWNGRKPDYNIAGHEFPDGIKISRMTHESCRAKNETVYMETKYDWPFLIADMKTGNFVTTQRHLSEHPEFSQGYLFQFNNDFGTNSELRTKLIDFLGIKEEQLALCSSVPKIAKSRAGISKETTFAYNILRNRSTLTKFNWTGTEIDLDTGGVYVTINNWQAADDLGVKSFLRFCNMLTNAGVPLPTIIGVKKKVAKKFQDHADWSSFYDWAKDKVQTLSKDYIKDLNNYKMCKASRFSDCNTRYFEAIIREGTVELEDGSDFKTFHDRIVEFGTKRSTYNRQEDKLDLMNYFKVTVPASSQVTVIDLVDQEELILKKYAVLTLLDSSWEVDTEKADVMLSIIKATDKKERV